MQSRSVFSAQSFKNPTAIYRPLQIIHGFDAITGEDPSLGVGQERLAQASSLDPFLSRLLRVGTGGIVTNVGFKNYLVSPSQWELLRTGLRKAADMGLRLWIYDEAGYPSGAAGGIVTRANPELVSTGLACYIKKVKAGGSITYPMPGSCRKFVWAGASRNWDVEGHFDLSSHIDDWDTLRWTAPEDPQDTEWSMLYLAERVMYEGTHASGNYSEFRQYINPLLPEATRAFIRVTHEAYYRELPPDLWKRIDAFFTDEPSLMTAYVQALPASHLGKIPVMDKPLFTDRPPAVPWTPDFLEQFAQRKAYDLKPCLWALFFSETPRAGQIRQDYYEVISALYGDAYLGQIRDWCRAHGTASSGHVLLEESVQYHAPWQGSLLGTLRRLDLPGLDMLNSDPQEMLAGESFMAVKQSASAAHLTGCAQVHSESSDFEQRNRGGFASLEERIGQGNLQAALGVNLITSYFSWEEIGEEGWKQYNDHMGRVSSLLTGGQHVCDVAVLYPIRSAWAHSLPPLALELNWAVQFDAIRSPWMKRLAKDYPALVRRLLTSQIDLDIIDEEALVDGQVRDGTLVVSGNPWQGNAFSVAPEAYRAIILPPVDALSPAALEALAAFARSGGAVFSLAPVHLLDPQAEENKAFGDLFGPAGKARVASLEHLPAALRASLPVDFTLAAPNPAILYTHRVLENRHIYFVTNVSPKPVEIEPALGVPGAYTLYRPLNGAQVPLEQPPRVTLEGYEGVFIVTH